METAKRRVIGSEQPEKGGPGLGCHGEQYILESAVRKYSP
jgi:hypothetical protein